MLKMLLNNEPPMGFGNKCPKILAYRRLIRMNMPVDDNGNVHFTTTLFALIRESLKIKTLNIQDVDDSEMDRADDELREVIKKLWPFQDIKQIQLALPPQSGKLKLFRFDMFIKLSCVYLIILIFKELHGKNGMRKMTVGKIYAGLLILENYRAYKLSLKLYGESRPVR